MEPLAVDVWDAAASLTIRQGPWVLLGYKYAAALAKPYFSPLVAPNAALPSFSKSAVWDSPADHPHHHGLWYGHGALDGIDFWLEEPGCGRIEHAGFEDIWQAEGHAGFVSWASWVGPDGAQVAADRRGVEVRVRDGEPGFVLDLDYALASARGHDLVAGQTVESGLPAVRVADLIDIFDGGHFLDSEGRRDHECTDNAARWCAAWGVLDASPPAVRRTCGIAVLDHPGNAGHPPRWFCRPFGWFTASGTQFGERVVPNDSRLRLRHRVVVFGDEPDPASLDALWDELEP